MGVHKNPCLVVGCTDEEALKEAFEKHGTVEGIHVPEGQNFAFVRFEDKYTAEVAMRPSTAPRSRARRSLFPTASARTRRSWNGRRSWPRRPLPEASSLFRFGQPFLAFHRLGKAPRRAKKPRVHQTSV